jgi:uncharacterized protein YodC (DUF2158 family)
MAGKFKVGDIVQLKSGGPKMTVEEVDARLGAKTVECAWFAGAKRERSYFNPDVLMMAPSEPTKK